MRIRIAAISAIVSISVALSGAAGAGQRPRVSPHESVNATIEGANVTITYGRPSMRGRAIFGALVPYGRVWCPGADEATVLDSARPLKLEQLDVPAGPHTIWILPTAGAWTLVVSKEPSGFHTRYNESADLGRVPLRKRALDTPVEQLTFAIDASPAGGGTIRMTWEKTEVSVPFGIVK